MSVVLCLATLPYALVVTDTRMSYNLHGELLAVNDAASKLLCWKNGWIAGAGFSEMIDFAIEEMQAADIIHTTQIDSIIEKTWRKFERKGRLIGQLTGKPVEDTGWAYSYVTWTNGATVCRVGINSKKYIGDGTWTVPPGRLSGLLPLDEDPEILHSTFEKYRGEVQDWNLPGALEFNIKLTARAILKFSELSESVSSFVDLGLLILSSPPGYSLFRLRWPADKIVDTRNFEELFSKMDEVVD